MRPLVLVVRQRGRDVDVRPALAAVPASARYLARTAGSEEAVPDGVQVIACADDESGQVTAVRAAHPDAVVVVIDAVDELSLELRAAIIELGASAVEGSYEALCTARLLGRAVALGAIEVAWVGADTGKAAPRRLPGTLVRGEVDVAETVALIDAVATRRAARRVTAGVGDFLWRPATALARRWRARWRDGVPGVIVSVLETYGEILTAAKAWERMTRARAGHREQPEGFRRLETHAGWLLVRRGANAGLLRVLAAATPDAVEGEPVASGGRGAAWIVTGDTGERAVLRWYRRGGLVRRVVRDRYLGWRPRPERELVLTEAARALGVPTAEVLAVRIDRVGSATYRGAMLTRLIEGSEPLGQVLATPLADADRRLVLEQVGRTLRRMHDRGVHHRDLNASNILICRDAGSLAVSLVDFDRACVRAAIPSWIRRRALRRLRRSLVKLGGAPEAVAADLSMIAAGYWSAA